MSFQFGQQPAQPSTPATRNRADRYINISLPRADGANGKIGSLRLYMDRADQKQLIDGLDSGAITVEQLKDAMVIDYRSGEPNQSGFVIG